jgi:MOSC domain-containing protein YiiM
MRVLRIFISPGHNFFGHHGAEPGAQPMIEVAEAQCLAGRGLAGDRFLDHKPDYKGQVTFFEQEAFEQLREEFAVFDRDVDAFRRNIIVSGQNLRELIGREFTLQGITFSGAEEAKPCYWMDRAFCPGAEGALRGRGGLRARILTDGILRAEEPRVAAAP